jgi:hydroxymethylglutaryl-CoA synthase
MRSAEPVGIVGYGGYVPMFRIRDEVIAKTWGSEVRSLPVLEKALPGPDEDTLTIAAEAAQNAIARAQINPREIGAVYVGTESKPYAVKPTGTVLAQALGLSNSTLAADMEFACKAGTEAFQATIGLVGSGMIKYGLAIGVDIAQGRPADELEFTAGAGGAAFVFGRRSPDCVAYVEGSYSFVSDTPDFWRRPGEKYPQHAGRFTGEPAYFKHIVNASKGLMSELGLSPADFDYVVFHQPNTKFPLRVASVLGFPEEKVRQGLLSPLIGNAYAGAAPLGLAATLDAAKPGSRILVTSFGSGAGSDSFSFVVADGITKKRGLAPTVEEYVRRRAEVDYVTYAANKGKILR